MRRQVTVEGAGLADGEDKLHEAVGDAVARAFLGFGPDEALRLVLEKRVVVGHGHAEVDVADDLRGVILLEEVLSDTVFQLFFADVYGVAGVHTRFRFDGTKVQLF